MSRQIQHGVTSKIFLKNCNPLEVKCFLDSTIISVNFIKIDRKNLQRLINLMYTDPSLLFLYFSKYLENFFSGIIFAKTFFRRTRTIGSALIINPS